MLVLHSVSCVCSIPGRVYHILFILLSTDGRLGFKYFVVIMTNAAMNIHLQVFVWTGVQFFYSKLVELLSIWQLCLVFGGTVSLPLQAAYFTFYQQYARFFFRILTDTYDRLFYCGHLVDTKSTSLYLICNFPTT